MPGCERRHLRDERLGLCARERLPALVPSDVRVRPVRGERLHVLGTEPADDEPVGAKLREVGVGGHAAVSMSAPQPASGAGPAKMSVA